MNTIVQGRNSVTVSLVRPGWVKLQSPKGVCFVRGYAFDGDCFLDSSSLAKKLLSLDEYETYVSRLSGHWGAVIDLGGRVHLLTDHIRSYQLLYRIKNGVVDVFDDLEEYRKNLRLKFCERSIHEYLSSGYVWGDATLFEGVMSLRAAEHVTIDVCGGVSNRYFRYFPLQRRGGVNIDELVNKIDRSFKIAIAKMLKSVGDARLVVPLSGGYDSRIVVNYLYRAGLKNVLCYTYGLEGNPDSAVSKKVATALGYEWHFVEKPATVRKSFMLKPEMGGFNRFISNGVNWPFIQDFYPLQELKSRGVLQKGDVVVPGHSFNVPAGSDLRKSCYAWNVVSEIIGAKAHEFLKGAWRRTKMDLRTYLRESDCIWNAEALEAFVWEEELVKFVFNTGRIYEWFGLAWRFPLADIDITKLWLSVPYDLRYDRLFFRSIFHRLAVAQIQNIPFVGYARADIKRVSLTACLRSRMPFFLRKMRWNGFGFDARSLSSTIQELQADSRLMAIANRVIDEVKLESVSERIRNNIRGNRVMIGGNAIVALRLLNDLIV